MIVVTVDGVIAADSSTDTRMPSGNEPQYDTLKPTFPRNSISNQVAGKVAMKKITTRAIRALNTVVSLLSARGDVPR